MPTHREIGYSLNNYVPEYFVQSLLQMLSLHVLVFLDISDRDMKNFNANDCKR